MIRLFVEGFIRENSYIISVSWHGVDWIIKKKNQEK